MSVPRIGLDMLYVAKLTADSESETTYDTSERIFNITEAGINFNMESETFHADDGPAVVASQMGDVEVTISIGDLTPEHFALLTGATPPAAGNKGVIDVKTSDIPPEFAVGFRSQKANGKYRYIWVMKGKFELPNSEYQTKADSVNFQVQELTYRAMSRVFDSKVMRRVDSDDTNLPSMTEAQLATQWFATPDVSPVEP